MYALMNKNTVMLEFTWEPTVQSPKPVVKRVMHKPWFISDLHQWILSRCGEWDRTNMRAIAKFWDISHSIQIMHKWHCVSLSDTLWVNKDYTLSWEDIAPTRLNFNHNLTVAALTGNCAGSIKEDTTPEFSTDGMLPKAWVRDPDGKAYLLKGSSEGSYEAYNEFYASQIIDRLGVPHARYDLVNAYDTLYSKCECFTNENEILVPLWCLCTKGSTSPMNIASVCAREGLLLDLAHYVLADAVTFNQDRHLGNVGIICDADTFRILRLAPIYDNGGGLLFHYGLRNKLSLASFQGLQKYSSGIHPKLYPSFKQGVDTLCSQEIKAKLNNLRGFKFERSSVSNLPEVWLVSLETLIQHQLNQLI